MWQNNLDKQIEFYISLKNQLQNSTALKWVVFYLIKFFMINKYNIRRHCF
jgi:hypothetical protein